MDFFWISARVLMSFCAASLSFTMRYPIKSCVFCIYWNKFYTSDTCSSCFLIKLITSSWTSVKLVSIPSAYVSNPATFFPNPSTFVSNTSAFTSNPSALESNVSYLISKLVVYPSKIPTLPSIFLMTPSMSCYWDKYTFFSSSLIFLWASSEACAWVSAVSAL